MCCSLLRVDCFVFVVYCLLNVVLLFVMCCPLFVVFRCSLIVNVRVSFSLFVASIDLFVVRCSLFVVVRCLSFVVRR